MKYLVPALKELRAKHNINGFHTSLVIEESYYVGIKIVEDHESMLPDEYLVTVELLNYLSDISNEKVFPKKLPDTYEMLDDLRKEILEVVDHWMMIVKQLGKTGKPIGNIDIHFKELADKQNNVLANYCDRLTLTKKEAGDLHMFFSPHRIVRGLTDEEVRICILLYPKRKEQAGFYPCFAPPPLHRDLLKDPDKDVQRTEGLQKAIYYLFRDIANRRPVVNS